MEKNYSPEPYINFFGRLQISYEEAKGFGYIEYQPILAQQNHWEINSFALDKSLRRKGIGSNLFALCIQDLKKRQCKNVQWQVCPLDSDITLSELTLIYEHIIENKIKKIQPGKLTKNYRPDNQDDIILEMNYRLTE